MNFVYGGLAIVASLIISEHFAKSKAESSKILLLSFLCQFFFVIALAGVFYAFGWGFVADITDLSEACKRVGGLAAFLGILVGMRSLNKRKRAELEKEDLDKVDLKKMS